MFLETVSLAAQLSEPDAAVKSVPTPMTLATDKAPGYTWVEIQPGMLKSFNLHDEIYCGGGGLSK